MRTGTKRIGEMLVLDGTDASHATRDDLQNM